MNGTSASLLVDVSNGRTKFALLLQDGLLTPVRVLPTAVLTVQSVRQLLAGWEFRRTMAACVVPAVRVCLEEALQCPVHWLGAASRLNLTVEYNPPSALGADRLACAMALVQSGGLPAIAVDAGTAVTFDLVVPGPDGPVYKGGAIAPGLQTMARSLASGTALLPEILLPESVPPIGRNTHDCLCSGLLNGFPGLVDGVLESIAGECPGAPRIVFTGGDAPFLISRTRFAAELDKMLVFKGLALADRLNR